MRGNKKVYWHLHNTLASNLSWKEEKNILVLVYHSRYNLPSPPANTAKDGLILKMRRNPIDTNK